MYSDSNRVSEIEGNDSPSSSTSHQAKSYQVSEDEKLKVKRARNNEHAKKSRRKKQAMEDYIKTAFVKNEKRIAYLENLEKTLSEELLSPIPSKKKTRSTKHAKRDQSHTESRPAWFGDAF